MFLSICIPTYNRSKDLIRNIKRILSILLELNEENVDIHIIDNASTDDTFDRMQEIVGTHSIVKYYRNENNIGAPRNVVKSFGISDSEYFMILGDDDYFSSNYLQEVLSILRASRPTMILGNFVGIDGDGTTLYKPREPIGKTISSDDYDEKVLWGLELAHQMSGLVYKRTIIDDTMMESLMTTMYPQSYLTMQMASGGTYYHILNNPIEVTQTNKKDWSYDISGYLFDLLSGFFYLPISKKDKERLERIAMTRPAITNGRLLLNYKHPFKMLRALRKEKRIEPGFKRFFFLYYWRKWIRFVVKKVMGKLKLKKGD